ncbi:MAG TPA: hypothetical protein VJL90_10235 [Pseudorhodoplanes sp.]|nr:hypothetical protein [Pseudorhodoplanes sp.]
MRTILLAALALSTVAVTAASAQSVRNQARTPAAYTVINQGKVIGADPDPYVRFELLREGDPTNANG